MKNNARASALLLLPLPERVPVLRTVRAAAPSAVAGVEGATDTRAALQGRLRALAGNPAEAPDPAARVQDDLFGVTRTHGDAAEALLLSFLLAHLDVYEDARRSGTSTPAEVWDALDDGVRVLFGGTVPRAAAHGARTVVEASPPPLEPGAAVQRWHRGHRLFFALTQAMIAALAEFREASRGSDAPRAAEALDAATRFGRASAAALRFTADFPPRRYDDTVRPSMMPPHVPEGFSGIQGIDHRALVRLFRALRPLFAALDPMTPHLRAFRSAMTGMFDAHLGVCSRFGGPLRPSLLMAAHTGHDADAPDTPAVRALKRLIHHREALLDPSGEGDDTETAAADVLRGP
ncbi:hypothetical protein [Streptomyces niveiscabiei]|uniref:Uncharacterized protein n=1 Tax=Streptomyces niveiscabiei TaxID=164115 RepID=A0ABW9HHF9_9ACTN